MSAPALVRADRCDRCRAQAFVRVGVPTARQTVRLWQSGDSLDVAVERLPLDFCAHHYREHESALRKAGARVLADLRHMLKPKESTGDVY